jgi:CRISPR system Cascade subunit CasD
VRHLILNLESPLMAFGGETIDNYGIIRRFPAASMLTGLFANALGWRRVEPECYQRLQERLVFAARIDREPHGDVRLTDFQTAQLNKDDKGWTTRGQPEGRAGGPNTYDAPHLRYRDYFADMRVTVALRLEPEGESPTLDQLAHALQEPARPLFIGRKPCLPSAPLFADFIEVKNTLDALLKLPLKREDRERDDRVRLLWSDGEGVDCVPIDKESMLTDERNWVSGLHGGGRRVYEGTSPSDCFGVKEERP